MLRLASFYFAYYAALGAFTPYWSLYLQSQGMGIAAISVLMSLWYATRIVSPSLWTTLAARADDSSQLEGKRSLLIGMLLAVVARDRR